MSRLARIFIPGYPHHTAQRGNWCSDVFETEAVREACPRFLGKHTARHGLSPWVYFLMTIQIHLVALPKDVFSPGRGLRDAHTVYAMYFNSCTAFSGHVWQGRFSSCPLDVAHLWAAVWYVERNPVKAGLVERAEGFRWSSVSCHCGLRTNDLLSAVFPTSGIIEDWPAWLAHSEEDAPVQRMRKETRTGRPCGDTELFVQMEAQLNRSARPQKRGGSLSIFLPKTSSKRKYLHITNVNRSLSLN